MRLDEHTEVLMDRLVVRENIMILGALAKNDSGKSEELEIKLAVKFQNATETRILPLPITDTSVDENGNYVGYAGIEYELDVLFQNRNLNEFTVCVQAYNGERYEDIIVEDTNFSQIREESDYILKVENGIITLFRKKKIKIRKTNWLISLLCSIYRIVEFVIGTLLIPLFLLDGIYVVLLGNRRKFLEQAYGGSQFKQTLLFAKARYSSFCRLKMNIATIKRMMLNIMASFLTVFCRKDSILFVSSRRSDVTGNIAYVNEVLQQKNAKVLFWLVPGKTKRIPFKEVFPLAYKIAKSRVVVVDDFTPLLNDIWSLKHCKLVQLWHACGAFKTFGFSRLGKDGGPNQTSRNHRNYDYAMVSSSEIRRFYAEGFGIDVENVKALGVPRTDDFFKEDYKTNIRKQLYEQYPVLKDKKIILFAPTFRGNGAGSARYPFQRFSVKRLLEGLGDEYMVIIKHHPFLVEQHPIEPEIESRVLDLSKESEINDLLFITDVLITDYSSVIFEASLLNIPMLFYAFDLEEYTVNRDFYYPFKNFVPGKIVRNIEQIQEAVKNSDYESEKVETFKHRFFDDLDGKSSERVAEFILSL